MKQVYIWILIAVSLPVTVSFGQLPPSPRPIVETDLRDNSIRMRSMELERLKREADKPIVDRSGTERVKNFAQIKSDFENLQKTQDSLVSALRAGNPIDYSKIFDEAKVIRKLGLRLNITLFGVEAVKSDQETNSSTKNRKGTKDLIVDLDGAVESFVHNDIFQNNKVVETKVSERAQLDLWKIIQLSDDLLEESKRMKELN